MGFKRFEDILAWQQARTLVTEIYSVTSSVDSIRRDIRMTDRMQKASVEIMTHISRGFITRKPRKFIEELYESLACSAELQSLLYICADLEQIEKGLFDRLSQMNRICSQMLRELIDLLTKRAKQQAASVRHRTKPPAQEVEENTLSDVLLTSDLSQLSPRETPTKKSRPYSKPKSKKSETGEYIRPDMTEPFDHDDVINPPDIYNSKHNS